MTSTRRSSPLTFRLISRSTLPGADDWPLSGVVRNRYAADEAAAPAAITPLINVRREGLPGIMSVIVLSSSAVWDPEPAWLMKKDTPDHGAVQRFVAEGARPGRASATATVHS